MIEPAACGAYQILEKVASGPLFDVFRARHRESDRVVALKAVHDAFAADPDFCETLRGALQTTTTLNHPEICRFIETGSGPDCPCFAVFEFARGMNLKDRVRRVAPFTLSVAVETACGIAEALAYAHSVGIVHGDLRPHNVIISPEGALKVADFGVQRAVAVSPAAQRAVQARAAPYRAPELSASQAGTAVGDVYALGAILYEMLTGAPLYAGDSTDGIAQQHAAAAIPSMRAVNPGVPRAVEGIAQKCLQKRPDLRYASAAELLADLKAVRDALRFGKPLSWSPIELDEPSTRPVTVAQPANANGNGQPRADAPQPSTMTTTTRRRAHDDGIPLFLKFAIFIMTLVVVGAIVGLVAEWSSMWAVPKAVAVPQLVGKSLTDAQAVLSHLKLKAILHGEYSDRTRDIVYKTDLESNQIRPGHMVNLWYSKGPAYVNVPSVVNLPREDAEQKLQDAGLTVGKVITDYSSKIPEGSVISQDVSSMKRVYHDTAVDLVVSDGPKPDYADSGGDQSAPANPPEAGATDQNQPTDDSSADNPLQPPNEPPGSETEQHYFDRTVTIPHDGKGPRQVTIEEADANGTNLLIDEPHNEGDQVQVHFNYYGKYVTLRVSYDGKPVWTRTIDPEATKHERIR